MRHRGTRGRAGFGLWSTYHAFRIARDARAPYPLEVVARAKPGALEARWAAAHHHLRHRVRGGCGGFLERHPAALQHFHLLLALQRRAAVAELQQAQTGGVRERQIVRVSCDSMMRAGVTNSWVNHKCNHRRYRSKA